MHDRRRRSRPAIVTPPRPRGPRLVRDRAVDRVRGRRDLARPRHRRPGRADPDHQCPRRHEPAVRRRAARHDPGDPGRGPPTGLLHEHRRQGRGRRRARPARAGVRPAASRPTTGCTSTTRATAATSSSRGSRPTPRAPMSSRAPPARCCSSSTAPRATTTAARWRSARTATCTSASATAGAAGIRATTRRTRRRLLGKILRINVNGTGHGPFDHYSVPRSNPFYGSTPGLEAIWDYGVRNPWRISFDRGTGKLFIARRRAEPLRGDRPREGRLHGRSELRLERDGGHALLHGLQVPARR